MTARLWSSFSRWALLIGILTMSLAPASSANAEILVLESLTCRRTEDSDVDECILQVRTLARVDRSGHDCNFRQSMMDTSRPWMLNRRVFINDTVAVALFDEDGPFDGDDCLGQVYIRPVPTAGTMTAVFNWDEAHYVLRYRVESETPPIRIRLGAPPVMRLPSRPH